MRLVQYYEYWEYTNTLVRTIMSYKPNADSLYKSMPISIMGYSDLNEIELSDGTIEYVERFDNQILVHKTIPNKWLVRMLSTEMTTRYD